MKAIISHDIDHLSVSEHVFSDMIIPKFIFRSKIELLSGKICVKEFVSRMADLLKNKWHNIDELITYNRTKNIPTSFFIGVRKGTGLNYSNDLAKIWANQIIERKCNLYVHGINFENIEVITAEKNEFEKVFETRAVGMRMHYVKRNEDTISNFAKAGYKFDSTVYNFENPYKVGGMWEFPFQIMDGWIIENNKKWQDRNCEKCKEATKKVIDKCRKNNLEYIGIDFHDRYFSNSFKTWIEWYCWLIDYLISEGINFIDFENAINELEKSPIEKITNKQ